MRPTDARGPVDYLVIELPPHIEGTRTVQALLTLVDAGTIHLLDVMLLRRNDDASVDVVNLARAAEIGLGAWSALAPSRTGMLGDDDVDLAAGVLHPNTIAAIVLYENTWAAPFVAAALDEGGRVMARSHYTAVEVMAQLSSAQRSVQR